MSIKNNTALLNSLLQKANSLPDAEDITPDLQEKTVTPQTAKQEVVPDSNYDGLSKVTVNAMPTATQATPAITVDANGKITASATQTAGYVSAGTKSATKQLTTKAATTITPTKSAQSAISSGTYATGNITVAAIPAKYQDVTNVTASADEIFEGEVVVDSNGNQITGTFTITQEVDTQIDLINQLKAKVNDLPDAEPNLQNKSVTPTTSSQTITADSGYDGLYTVTVNAMPTATQATPSITVNSSGLITASATQTAGYVSAGTKSATKQLTTKSATTITPTTSEQVAVSSGTYVIGDIKVAAVDSSGGSSSTSYETCNLEVSTNTDRHVTYLGLENGIPQLKWTTPDSGSSSTNHSITNVICGSYCIIQLNSTLPGYNISDNAEFIEMFVGYYSYEKYMVFKITANQGETVVITCYDDD